jgi:D-alanyl-D-alanine carboxypeptidase (penicillin-binding protein 5/6)
MRILLSLALALFWALPAHAQLPQPPEIAARQYILLDLASNQVLATRDADAQADPASLTKLMTAYLVFNAIRDKKLALDQALPVSMRAWSERKGGGSLMFIDTTMRPKVDELLKGMIVQSGNDASVALAEGVGGSVEKFVEMMNRQAQAWGLKNTQFKQRHRPDRARPPQQCARRGHHRREDHHRAPDLLPAVFAAHYSFNNIKQDNRNLLLGRDPAVDGMKTGYTDAAGYCLVASAVRDGPGGKRRLVSVVLGTASREARAAESQKLLNWGWQAWDTLRLFDAGKAVAVVPVWKGKTPTVRLGTPGAIHVTVPKGEGDKLKTTLERTDPLVAPLTAGQRVGTLKVSSGGGTVVAEVPLTVLEPVELAGLFGRAWDAIRLWIK